MQHVCMDAKDQKPSRLVVRFYVSPGWPQTIAALARLSKEKERMYARAKTRLETTTS